MNTGKGIVLKLISAVLFAVMSALIRYLGARYPIGEVVFFRSAFAIVPVVLVYAWRGELMAAVRTESPLGQASRGALSIVGMFCNFGALARLPLIEANAISFTSPLISVALAALVLKERVRIYRWSAVTIGFLGVLVVLAPHLSGDELTIAMASATSVAGVIYAVAGSVTNAGTMIQTRHLTKSETTSSIVFYFSLICALAGLVTWPFGWITPTSHELVALMCIGFLGGTGHIFLTESYRYASASMVAPFDYTSMIWALVLGYAMFGEMPTVMIVVGSAIIAGAGLFVIWREHQLALARRRAVEGATTSPKRLEGDDGARVGDPGNGLHLLGDEMADIGRGIDVEFHQQIEVAGGRIDFRGDLGVRELIGDLVGLAELTFDLHEKGDHARLRTAKIAYISVPAIAGQDGRGRPEVCMHRSSLPISPPTCWRGSRAARRGCIALPIPWRRTTRRTCCWPPARCRR